MTRYWELDLYIYLVLCSFVLVGLLVLRAWWQDRRKWRAVKPYYGKPYDARERQRIIVMVRKLGVGR